MDFMLIRRFEMFQGKRESTDPRFSLVRVNSLRVFWPLPSATHPGHARFPLTRTPARRARSPSPPWTLPSACAALARPARVLLAGVGHDGSARDQAGRPSIQIKHETS